MNNSSAPVSHLDYGPVPRHAASPSAPNGTGLRGGDPRSFSTTLQFCAKRALDYEGAILALALLAPLMVIVAVAIRLESRGPIFFRQPRVGRNGRVFRMWKFRTMVVDAEARLRELEAINESAGGVLFKMRNDPRVTRVGGFLRRTSLDELPQLFNIVRGEMSLVGPRPLPLRDCEILKGRDRAGYLKRHEVLPGLTGLWQVSGRSRLGGERMVELDREYIALWSIWRDLTILLRTVAVVLFDQ